MSFYVNISFVSGQLRAKIVKDHTDTIPANGTSKITCLLTKTYYNGLKLFETLKINTSECSVSIITKVNDKKYLTAFVL